MFALGGHGAEAAQQVAIAGVIKLPGRLDEQREHAGAVLLAHVLLRSGFLRVDERRDDTQRGAKAAAVGRGEFPKIEAQLLGNWIFRGSDQRVVEK